MNSYYIISPQIWFINDSPQSTQKIIEKYLHDAHTVFLNKLQIFTDFQKLFTEKDEKHLSTMLHLMVEARKSWEDENHN